MKRKQHNAFKRAQTAFSNVRLWSWESMREDGTQIAHGMARIGYVWRDLDQQQVTGIIAKPNNWVVICRALCELNGETCIEDERRSAQHLKVNDFEMIYREMRAGVLASAIEAGAQVQDVGWIIQSFGKADKIDNDDLPLFQIGKASQERRERWLMTDSDIKQDLEKVA